MRPGRLLVDGLGAECIKIEKVEAIPNARDADQLNTLVAPSIASSTPDTCSERSAPGEVEMTNKATDPKRLSVPLAPLRNGDHAQS